MSRLQFKLAYTSSEDLLQINMAQKQLNDAQKQMCEVLLDLYLMVGVVY